MSDFDYIATQRHIDEQGALDDEFQEEAAARIRQIMADPSECSDQFCEMFAGFSHLQRKPAKLTATLAVQLSTAELLANVLSTATDDAFLANNARALRQRLIDELWGLANGGNLK